VLPHLGEYRRTHFFAVCDGHGVNGKLVSEYVKTMLGKEVEQSIKFTFDNAKINKRVVDSTEVKDQLDKSFNKVTDSLFHQSGINLRFSGSTCVTVLIVGNKVFCANVGDSRATLARRKEFPGPNGITQHRVVGLPLNRDHKADQPDEHARIIGAGGRVAAYRDMQGNPLGPARVWHLHEDIPGLAMSRSFGDQAASEVGVTSIPEITELNLIEADKFLILASDGVWEFISNDQAVNIVMPHYLNNSAEKAAEALIREAIKRW
jgi:serine/threonine protein phosphatase PrpC